MGLVRLVLLFDVFSLELGILLHLSDGFCVFLLNGNDLLLTVFNFVQLLFHAGLMGLFLSLNFLLVLASFHLHFILEDLTALVFASLQLLEERSVFKHF